MASIVNDPNGRRRIQFIGADEKRRTIRLGKVSRRIAESIKVRVEDLAGASISGHPASHETMGWLEGLDKELYDKLANAGLAKPRDSAYLGAYIDAYIARRTDVKQTTRTVYMRVRRYLVDYFGEDKPLRDVSPGDADAWRLALLERELAENTIRKSCGVAKQFFTAAVRSRLIPDNPFSDLPAIVKSNPDRYHYVTREDAASVIDACPSAEWRLLFALARYGGLRVPSETTRLRWADIDWDRNRFTVTSPKTEHHDGQGTRVVPIFPELLPFLRESFEQAEPGQVYCLPTKRDSTANLRTQLLRIIGRASLEPWPKLWQNLRSTRETELADQYPAHVASKWIGNSVAVAAKHYLQVTEDHMAQAAQNAAQQLHETTGNGPKAIRTENHSAVVSAAGCENLQEKTAPCELQEAVSDGPYWT